MSRVKKRDLGLTELPGNFSGYNAHTGFLKKIGVKVETKFGTV